MAGQEQAPKTRSNTLTWIAIFGLALLAVAVTVAILFSNTPAEDITGGGDSTPVVTGSSTTEPESAEVTTRVGWVDIEPWEPFRTDNIDYAGVVDRSRVVLTTTGESSRLSPDGRLLFLEKGHLEGSPSGANRACLIDVDLRVEQCVEVIGGGYQASWSHDSTKVVFSNPANPDIFVFDSTSGSVTNITDDEAFDLNADSRGQVPIDSFPAFLIGDERIVFHRIQPTAGNEATGFGIGIVDVGGGPVDFIPSPTKLSADGSRDLPRIVPRWHPLPSGVGSVLVGGDGAVFRVNPTENTITELYDYSGEYSPSFVGFNVLPELQPVAQLNDQLILVDPAIWSAIGNGQTASDGPGAYTYSQTDGLQPLIALTTPSDLLGPIAIGVSRDSSAVAFRWMDSARRNESINYGKSALSIAPLSGLPIEPRLATELWLGSLASTGELSFEWAENGYVALPITDGQDRGVLVIRADG